MTTRRFTPPPTHIGGAIPFDGMEQYHFDEATDEELHDMLRSDSTPRWLMDEIRAELHQRTEEDDEQHF